MPGPSRTLVIDARPRGPRGPLAGERVLGRPVLAHLVDLARECGGGRGAISVHARIDEHGTFRGLVSDAPAVVFATGPPPEGAAILRTDRLYDPARLRRALRSGRDPEFAVIWRLDRPSAIAAADEEVMRRRLYQPLGRFWALAPARALAHALCPTRVRPNAVTLVSAAFMLIASAVVAYAPDGVAMHLIVAVALALGLVLDTADGHLARLQGTASEFGRWLDAVLDELSDMLLHAAIAWGGFRLSGDPGWLLLALAYAMGKYLFVVAQQGPRAAVAEDGAGAAHRPSHAARVVRMIGHADVRWHLWIVLAGLGRLDAALVVYAAYFPIRTIALAVRKAVRHA